MSDAAILSIVKLNKRFGGLVATQDVSLDVAPGEVHALIGPTGAGKTTLISQLQGSLTPDSGAIIFRGRDIVRDAPDVRARMGLARSFQITAVLPDFTALENVRLAVQAQQGHSFRFFAPAAKDAGDRKSVV